MYRITKQFEFSASHELTHLDPSHKCFRCHGHNYIVEVVVECVCLDDRGFCQVDYGEMALFKAYLDEYLDHRHLNDVLLVRPTAENLAKYLCEIARRLVSPYVVAIRVSETPKTWAEWRSPA
jgi:6-pyruvoyltetrahydropterin/6-carboxytetrahydropterin synthase